MVGPDERATLTQRPRERRWRALLVAGSCAVVVAGADLLLKWVAEARLDTTVDLGVARLALAHNTGVAFSLGAELPTGLIVGATAAITLVLAVGIARGVLHPPGPAGGVLGGAMANVVDRGVDGRVTDYLALGWWPTFNLADAAITLGAAALVWASVRDGSRAPASTSADGDQLGGTP